MMEPTYLVIRSKAPYARFCRFVENHKRLDAELIAARGMHELTAWEPGSMPLHTWIARFDSMELAKDAWANMDSDCLSDPEPPLVIAVKAIPEEGFPPEWDFVPTAVNVRPDLSQPPTLMIIEGGGSDESAMDAYRDIILPMLKERGAFYICFEIGGTAEVLSGDWDQPVFAISRWSKTCDAEDFWLSSLYQEKAIPIRMNCSSFTVVTMEGERDNYGGNE